MLTPPVRIFLSYVPQDEPLRAELRRHLRPFERSDGLVLWDAGQIHGGGDSAHSIAENLNPTAPRQVHDRV